MAKSTGSAGRAGTTEALTPVGGARAGRLAAMGARPAPERPMSSIYLGETVGPAGQARYKKITDFERNMKVGQRVRVRWGYGSGFRAQGVGELVKINRGSVQVRLVRGVASPYRTGGEGWPTGFVLKGIPKFAGNNWDYWNSVEPE